MSLSSEIAPHLPYLRRYARALAGSQASGDAYVRACLEALVAAPEEFNGTAGPRVGLYRLFSQLWNSAQPSDRALAGTSPFEEKAHERLMAMTPERRQMLLLTTLEGFSRQETAVIVGANAEAVEQHVAEALAEIERQTTARVLIIEDEPMIAMDLIGLIEESGHTVAATARTASEAVAAAAQERPGLVLADIQLADGSSGIDAVNDILSEMHAPVIFITAFPERLLTGERPEPTYLITKPYDPLTVKAAVAQALFFDSTAPVG